MIRPWNGNTRRTCGSCITAHQPRAHYYLDALDLGNELSGPNAVGGLDVFENSNMVSCWRGVRADDEVTLSLLQRRLNDLGTGIRIVTGYAI